jgi:hypothetical protein
VAADMNVSSLLHPQNYVRVSATIALQSTPCRIIYKRRIYAIICEMSDHNPEISCESCIGACCRKHTMIVMSREEVKNNQRKMRLKKVAGILPFDQSYLMEAEGRDEAGRAIPIPTVLNVPAGYGAYILTADCGNLTADNQCVIYDSPERPAACAALKVGDEQCLAARAAFYLDGVSVELIHKPE